MCDLDWLLKEKKTKKWCGRCVVTTATWNNLPILILISMHLNYSAIWLIWLATFDSFVHSGRCVERAFWLYRLYYQQYFENIYSLPVVVVSFHSLLTMVAIHRSLFGQVLALFVYSCCWSFYRPSIFVNYFRIKSFYQSQYSMTLMWMIKTMTMMIHSMPSTFAAMTHLHLHFGY